MATIVDVASDFLQSKVARKREEVLKDERHTVRCLTGEGQNKFPPDVHDILAREIPKADIVIISISDNSKMEEVAGRLAIEHSKPLIIDASGTYGACWGNSRYDWLTRNCGALFVTDEEEQKLAQKLVLGVNAVVTGSPEWEDWLPPKYTRDEVRVRLGISPDEIFILVAGEKNPLINLQLAAAVLEALLLLVSRDKKKFRTLMWTHPGDQSPPEVYADILALAEMYGISFGLKRRPSPPPADWIGTPDAVVGADCVIHTNSLVGIQAAVMGIPSISWLLRPAFRQKMPTNSFDPWKWWPPLARGRRGEEAIIPLFPAIDSPVKLSDTIHKVVDSSGFAPHRESQRKYFPAPPAKGHSVGLMMKAIRQILG